MIRVFKGETLTSTATEDEVLFLEKNDGGDAVPIGRTKIDFVVLSGTVQVGVGGPVDTSKATSHTTSAATSWSMTISNQGYTHNGPQEGNNSNLRIVGVGTVAVNW